MPDYSQSDPYSAALPYGFNPRGYPQAPGYNNAPQYNVNWSQLDPGQAMRENRTMFADQGGRMDQGLAGEQQYRGGLENYYRDPMNESYSDFMRNPGYTGDEASGIKQDQVGGYRTTDQEYEKLNPLDEEFSGMAGNPGGAWDYFHPDNLRTIDSTAAQNANSAAARATNSMDDSVGYQAQDLNNAVDPSQLAMSHDYAVGAGGDLANGSSEIRGAINKGDLSLTPDFLQKYQMSDRDVQDLVDQAGTTVQNKSQSDQEAIQRAAQASGNADPLAIAAAKSRVGQQGMAAAGDAMTNARIAAKNAQAQRLATGEGMRIGANESYAGMRSGAEKGLLDTSLGQRNTEEGMRIGAQQDISNRKMNVADTLAQERIDNAKYGGNMYTDLATKQGATAAATERDVEGTGMGLHQYVDQAHKDFWTKENANRTDNLKYQQQNKYGQGMGVAQFSSGANKTVADARRTDQGQAREWLTGQTNTQLGAGQTATGQRLQNYGIESGAINNATGQWGNYDMGRRNGGFGAAFKSAAGKTLGSPSVTFGGGG